MLQFNPGQSGLLLTLSASLHLYKGNRGEMPNSDTKEQVLYVSEMTHRCFFRQDFQKVNDMCCFKCYMPD